MKIRIYFTTLAITLLSITMLSSCSTKQSAIRHLQNLSYDLRDNSSYYTIKDWQDVAKEFAELRDKMARFRYTPEERRKIGEIEGQCARYMVQGIKNGAINGILGVGNEIRGILDGLGIKY